MSLSHDEVMRVARLARIALAPEEAAAIGAQLNRVLELVDRMQAVDTAGAEPMAHALEVSQRLRPDAVTEPDHRALHQSLAPAVEGGFYLVPRVVE